MSGPEPYWADETVTLHLGDCLEVLAAMETASVDAVVTDPPAAVSFMGRSWDSDRGGRDKWVGWLAERMEAAARVLKPGGHLLVWSLPRTSHWTAWALEDAGLEIRDCVLHLFGQRIPEVAGRVQGDRQEAGGQPAPRVRGTPPSAARRPDFPGQMFPGVSSAPAQGPAGTGAPPVPRSQMVARTA